MIKNGHHPRHTAGSNDTTTAHDDLDQLLRLTAPHPLAIHMLDRIAEHVPTLAATTITQIRARLEESRVRTAGCSPTARPVLDAFTHLYQEGPGAYFSVLVDALEACTAAGHHIPSAAIISAYRRTAATCTRDLNTDLTNFARHILSAGLTAPREENGLFVMTTHQAKGREFDAVILPGTNRRNYPDNTDGRHLFYVALTRGRSQWTLIASEADPSPLLTHI